MKVNCNINDVIDFLIKKRDEGYTSVELVDDVRASGWFYLEPKLEFIFNKNEPKIVGIDARSEKANKNRV